jgi:hypothetical protein
MELDNETETPTQLSNTDTEKKRCPRCGKPGTGPYLRWVENSVGKRYWYNYFAHREGDKQYWCYIGKAKKVLDNDTVPLPQSLSNFYEKRECSP